MCDLVSIIVPVYNREDFVQETIASVQEQTYPHWELILVDDGSKDRSIEIMEKASMQESRIKVFSRPKKRPGGANAARNFGFEMAAGTYVNWFDSDDIMHPEFIERKIKVFENSKIDVVFSRTIRTDFRNEYISDDRLKSSNDFLQDYIIRRISWYLPDAMFRKSFLESKNLFDENILAGQDRDFYIRIFAKKIPEFKILDFHATYYRMHPSSISEKIYREGNINMQFSHYQSLLNQINVLKKNRKLTPVLRVHYLNELKKRLPAVIKSKNSVYSYLKNLSSLSRPNIHTSKIWVQVFIAYLSFTITGKGDRFLK